MPTKPTRRRRDAATGAPAQADPTIDPGQETSQPPLEPAGADGPAESRPHRPVRARTDRDRAKVIDVP